MWMEAVDDLDKLVVEAKKALPITDKVELPLKR